MDLINEYIKIVWMNNNMNENNKLYNAIKYISDMEQSVISIKQVSGYTLEQILEMFLKGYTLKAPELYKNLNDLDLRGNYYR